MEHRPKTRHLKEAGSSTNSTTVIISSVKRRASKDSTQGQVSQIKPANETLASGDISEKTKVEGKQTCCAIEEPLVTSKVISLGKSASLGENSYQHGDRFLKNSIKVSSQTLLNNKNIDA